MTQSEDDLDLSGIRSRRSRKKRPSVEAVTMLNKRQRKSGTVGLNYVNELTSLKFLLLNYFNFIQTIELQSNDRLIAKTIVSFPKDGQVTATASLEAVPAGGTSKSSEAMITMQPTAPPLPTSGSYLVV